MPTIYDSYRIEWDGNSLSCENDVIIGYNTSNKTRLEFVNTSSRTDVRFTSIEFRTPLSRIGFDLPDDGKIELSLNPVLYGADSDLALFWEADDGKTGAAHMRVMIVESEYYHDEETEQQADDNTQGINLLKARVAEIEQQADDNTQEITSLKARVEALSGSVETVEENYNTLSDSVGLLTTEVGGVNNTIHSAEKSVIGYESGSPALLSPYTLGDTVELTPDQIAAFGFGPDAQHKLGWSEFSIRAVTTPPSPPDDRSFIRVTVIFNQGGAGGYQETSLTATLSGTFMGDEILVWRYFHEIGLFVPYFKSLKQPDSLESAGIYPRVVSANIGGNMYTRPNFSQNVASIHLSSAASDNISFNGGFALQRYNVPPYFSE